MDLTEMSLFQVTGAALGVGLLWSHRHKLRHLIQALWPQGVPGETNTSLLATARHNRSTPTTAKDLEDAIEYDYIIVGTGTAGCVLANRLTEDTNVKVLAIEAGHSDLRQIMSRIPAGVPKMFHTSVDWDLKTTAQPHCANRELYWPRGKMIGGCSSINAMLYTKGAPDDYNEWAKLGNKGWAYKDLAPYMKKAEKFRPSQDPTRRITKDDMLDHGTDGPWNIGYTYQAEILQPFPEACNELGVPKTTDINTSRGMIGAAPAQTFIDDKGQRSSTAVAYLSSDVIQRPNLKIASGQSVTRIIFDQSGSQPRAVGIEMAASAKATRFVAKARKEVILSSGSVGSPQLLKLSGIGPAAELKSHDIPVVNDLPGVGENLMDHMAYHAITFKAPLESSIHYCQDIIKGIPSLIRWFRHGTGPFTSQACNSFAWIRTADMPDIPASLKGVDKSSGPTGPDLELLAFSVCFTEHGNFIAPCDVGYGSISAVSLRPEARGTVKLASKNPFAKPIIDPNALNNDYDMDILLYGTRLATKAIKSNAYKKYFQGWYKGPHHPLDWDTASDDEIKAHIRKTCETLYHPMGTAKMGHDDDAVVDDQLKVHGVSGLRVVDASIFPTPLACHPCAPVVAVAEKAADLIKAAN